MKLRVKAGVGVLGVEGVVVSLRMVLWSLSRLAGGRALGQVGGEERLGCSVSGGRKDFITL